MVATPAGPELSQQWADRVSKLSDKEVRELRSRAKEGDIGAKQQCLAHGIANSKTHGPDYREFVRMLKSKVIVHRNLLQSWAVC